MATEPAIVITEQVPEPATEPANVASNIAVIGAFDSQITDLTICTDVREAHQLFGTMEVEDDFKGTDVIDPLFTGATALYIINTTTWDGDTPETTLTDAKLTEGLNKLHNEVFDTLFIAEQLTDAQQEIVTAWIDKEFEAKYCHGQILQVQKSTASEYEIFVEKVNNNVYYINTQTFTVNGEAYGLNRSTAYIAGYIASIAIDASLTYQEIPKVSKITPEYSTAPGEMGAVLLNLNIPFLKCRNRRTQKYYCVNSMLPDGFDLYINRTRDTVLNNIAAETVLGNKNTPLTENGVVTLMEGLKQHYVNDLGLLKNIVYHTYKDSKNPKCINIAIDYMEFDDIITTVNVFYSVKVSE